MLIVLSFNQISEIIYKRLVIENLSNLIFFTHLLLSDISSNLPPKPPRPQAA